MTSKLWQPRSLSITSCNPYIEFLGNSGFTLMLLFFKVLQFCFQVVYQTVSPLDDCSGLVNFLHQLQYKLNVALILKLYLLRCFSWFLNDMADFIQVSLATIFHPIFVLFLFHILLKLISFLFYLSTILLLLLRISLTLLMIFRSASLTILISCWIEACFWISAMNLEHCLTLHNAFFCFPIYFYECNKVFIVV